MREVETSRGVILCCDVREGLAQLEDNSVDALVTDPPYELGFMGRKWDKSGIAYQVEVWSEALRVLKPGGWLVSFGGCRTYHRLACAIEDAGFELRDSLLWLFGQGFPKSMDVGRMLDKQAKGTDYGKGATASKRKAPGYARANVEQGAQGRETYEFAAEPVTTPEALPWVGWGTALKPAYEPIVLARKPISEKTVAANVLRWGTGALNIDGSRIGTRWPANVILQCLCDEVLPGPPEVVQERQGEQTQATRYAEEGVTDFAATPGARRTGGGVIHTNPECPAAMVDAQAAASRFFYCSKASRKEREEGLEGLPPVNSAANLGRKEGSAGLDNPRAGAGRTRKEVRNTHPTVKPLDLMRWLVRLVTPPGGLVLDPFCGSGSTLIAAVLEQCEYIGIDLDADYCTIADHRVHHWERAAGF